LPQGAADLGLVFLLRQPGNETSAHLKKTIDIRAYDARNRFFFRAGMRLFFLAFADGQKKARVVRGRTATIR
jgi:hypothetical protein